MALSDYLAVKQKFKYQQFLPHSAGKNLYFVLDSTRVF